MGRNGDEDISGNWLMEDLFEATGSAVRFMSGNDGTALLMEHLLEFPVQWATLLGRNFNSHQIRNGEFPF